MKLIALLLLPVVSLAQTWPSDNCPDRPYIKGNSDIIYHTCDCGAKKNYIIYPIDSPLVTKYYKTPTPAAVLKTYGEWSTEKHSTKNFDQKVKNKCWARDVEFNSAGQILKGTIHNDSLWCSVCKKVLPYQHVRILIQTGILRDTSDNNGWYRFLTKRGIEDFKKSGLHNYDSNGKISEEHEELIKK